MQECGDQDKPDSAYVGLVVAYEILGDKVVQVLGMSSCNPASDSADNGETHSSHPLHPIPHSRWRRHPHQSIVFTLRSELRLLVRQFRLLRTLFYLAKSKFLLRQQLIHPTRIFGRDIVYLREILLLNLWKLHKA